MSPVAVHTIFQIDMNSNKATPYTGDPGFIEFCSNADCIVIFHDKSVFGMTMFELWENTPRTLEVLTPGKKTKWHAVPMQQFDREVKSKFPVTKSCPQDPPVGG